MKINLAELIEAGILDQERADRIRAFYAERSGQSQNRLVVAFGLLGAALVGLGLILIIAHNWDMFSRGTKTFFAFLPLVIGQLLCLFVLLKRKNSVAWREGAATFLFFAVGACISMIGQIYHLPGNLSELLLSWMLLCVPLVYIMPSSMVSLLYLIGITYYAGEVSYWRFPNETAYLYWPLLAAILPHYYQLYRNKPRSNFMLFHNWFIPLSLLIALGTLGRGNGEVLFVGYMSLLGLFYLIGSEDFFQNQKLINNGWLVLGSLGTIILLLILSFEWVWEELLINGRTFSSLEFFATLLLYGLAAILLFRQSRNLSLEELRPLKFVFLIFLPVFFLGTSSPASGQALVNLLVLATGLWTAWLGAQKDSLGLLNYGLLIIAALVTCRFFDANLTFVARGILFLIVGTGFFLANYWMLKKRNHDDSQ
jgi:hypothetical protein